MEPELRERLRSLPGVDAVLEAVARQTVTPQGPVLAQLCREAIDAERARIRSGSPRAGTSTAEDLAHQVIRRLNRLRESSPQRVINATGILVHTNLGRSPLSEAALSHMHQVGATYSDLELDLEVGKRGSRQAHTAELLCLLTGAEDALVVNNNAAAVVLALAATAPQRDVVVSRGELVEIGGSFRVPDICAQSGARLREVGTTNRTHLRDYESTIGPETGLLLKVHTSNYRIEGFTAEVSVTELVTLGRTHNVPVMVDLGSGALMDLASVGVRPEPRVQEVVAAGADLVTWSGDKLLGGPQAGIVVGKQAAVDRLRRHPLARALRIDKLVLAGLQSTLAAYLDPDRARTEIPVLRMLSTQPATLEERARQVAQSLNHELSSPQPQIQVEPSDGAVGGGALPTETVPTWVVAVDPRPHGSAEHLQRALRRARPAVLGRLHEERLLLDVRTLSTEDCIELPALIAAAWTTVLKGE